MARIAISLAEAGPRSSNAVARLEPKLPKIAALLEQAEHDVRSDEFGELADGFDHMLDRLHDAFLGRRIGPWCSRTAIVLIRDPEPAMQS